ncbi:hypothetical protein MTR_4g030100 [Medicago truncatula]|uniref:Uncharacterized protein n=1 Tax=Medicago truncatula TaxID=3880 RepID=G7JKR6_MEDTR|nr:hypothetical protein MTR_4g030100 [Medicago truncatula]
MSQTRFLLARIRFQRCFQENLRKTKARLQIMHEQFKVDQFLVDILTFQLNFGLPRSHSPQNPEGLTP